MLHVSAVRPTLCVYLQKKLQLRKHAILIIYFLWYRTNCKQKLDQLIKSWVLFTFLCVCVCARVCVMRSHNSVESKLDTKQWTIVWCTLSAHVRTAEVSARLLRHFIITLSVSLNVMRVTLLPTVRTVHALHQLTTQQTPRPSGNWEAQGSIPDLPSLATVPFVFLFRRVRITVERRMQLCHSARPSEQTTAF
jgi:hypothetical protein